MATPDQTPETIRLDKWLWAARFFKTRTLSQDNIELGRVRVNQTRVKPSKEIRVGDEVEVFRGNERFIVIVKALSAKRGPAQVAATLYEETPESKFKREQIKETMKLIPIPGADHRGRPTKREGRKLREFKSSFDPSQDI